MSENRLPPKVASWLLRSLGCSRNNEAMLGDIQEQFVAGKSRLWFWLEVAVAIVTGGYASILTRRRLIVKRAMVWTMALVGVFFLGYWTALSPIVIREEMPSATEIAENRERAAQRTRSSSMRAGTITFLEGALERAEADYRNAATPEAKAAVGALRSRLEQFELRAKEERSQ
jgi:hypothetical protein